MHTLYIPDGHRRYAQKHKISLEEAYAKGGENIARIIKWLSKKGVSDISIFILAEHNLNRREEEVLAIAKGARYVIEHYFITDPEIMKFKFDVVTTEEGGLVSKVKAHFLEIAEATKDNDETRVNFLVGYSGETEVTTALESNPQTYRELVGLSRLKPIDIIIRADPIIRLSESPILPIHKNTAFFATRNLNPEVTTKDLKKILEDYRRHGNQT